MDYQTEREWTRRGIDYTLSIASEDLLVRGNALASGDAEMDRQVEDGILERLERGEIWAWCSVRIEASAGSLTGTDYLGGCCYEGAEDFLGNPDAEGWKPEGYAEDMIGEAREDLLRQMEQAAEALRRIKEGTDEARAKEAKATGEVS